MMTLNDFKVGDVLLFTQRSKRGEEKRVGVVTEINLRVNYGPAYNTGADYLATGQGSFDPTTVGTKPFGFYCAVEVIGHQPPHRSWYPKPGDTGYDLMC